MATPEALSTYSQTASSNTPAGTDTIGTNLDNELRDIKKNVRFAANVPVQTAKTTAYTQVATDMNQLIQVNATASAVTVALLAASTAGDGFKQYIRKINDSAGNDVVIDPDSSETIDGSATYTLSEQYQTVCITCDGSNWHVVGEHAKASDLVNDTSPQLGGDLDLNGNNIDFPTTSNIDDVIDDDTMATADANNLATAESIKAYADNHQNVGGNVLAAHENLIITRPTAATVDIDADTVLLKTTGGLAYRATSVDLTVNITSSGANGLDTGSEASSTWYYLWVIYNGTTVAGLISTDSAIGDISFPSGYTYAGLVGAFYNDSGDDILDFRQKGHRSIFDVMVQDYNGNLTTSNDTYGLTAPPNTIAFLVFSHGGGSSGNYSLAQPTWQSDGVPAATNFNAFSTSGDNTVSHIEIEVDGSSEIKARTSSVVSVKRFQTAGFLFE